MSYNIEVTAFFAKQMKRLAKKFPSLKKEFAHLIAELKDKPEQGKNIGNACYKIRLAIASKNKGKRGGARVITHIQIEYAKVYLLSIYDKADQNDISDQELDTWLSTIVNNKENIH